MAASDVISDCPPYARACSSAQFLKPTFSPSRERLPVRLARLRQVASTAPADPEPAVELGLLPLLQQIRGAPVDLWDVGGARLAVADRRIGEGAARVGAIGRRRELLLRRQS